MTSRTSPIVPSGDPIVPRESASLPVARHALKTTSADRVTKFASALSAETSRFLEEFVMTAVIVMFSVPLALPTSASHRMEAVALPTTSVVLI